MVMADVKRYYHVWKGEVNCGEITIDITEMERIFYSGEKVREDRITRIKLKDADKVVRYILAGGCKAVSEDSITTGSGC